MKQHAPATNRNREPIGRVLQDAFPVSGMVLEIAAGTGQHAVYFASLFPDLLWQPSDPDAVALASIAAWRAEAKLDNLMAPLLLDAAAAEWPIAHADAILCINMVHISPWEATLGLLRGAGRILQPGAPVILYGPYRRAEVTTAPSNEAFDLSLKARNPQWGLRDLKDVQEVAAANQLVFDRLFEMPANNLSLIFRRA